MELMALQAAHAAAVPEAPKSSWPAVSMLRGKNATKRDVVAEAAKKAFDQVVDKAVGAVPTPEAVPTPKEEKFLGIISDKQGNTLPIPIATMEAKLQGRKDEAAETFGKCTGVLQAAFDEKKEAADKKFAEDTAPLRGKMEAFTAKAAKTRDGKIAVVRGEAMNAADALRSANSTLVEKRAEIAKIANRMAGWQATREGERPAEQAKVDTVKADGVAAVKKRTKKSQSVYAAKTKPLPPLQKNEQEEAAAECAAKRGEIVKDGALIDDLTAAAKREAVEKKA